MTAWFRVHVAAAADDLVIPVPQLRRRPGCVAPEQGGVDSHLVARSCEEIHHIMQVLSNSFFPRMRVIDKQQTFHGKLLLCTLGFLYYPIFRG